MLIEGLSHFLTNFLQNLASCQTALTKYRSTRTAWRVTQWPEIPPTSGAHLSVGSGSVQTGENQRFKLQVNSMSGLF
jgi:hypothetical protein